MIGLPRSLLDLRMAAEIILEAQRNFFDISLDLLETFNTLEEVREFVAMCRVSLDNIDMMFRKPND